MFLKFYKNKVTQYNFCTYCAFCMSDVELLFYQHKVKSKAFSLKAMKIFF